jgi:hypothetical protein
VFRAQLAGGYSELQPFWLGEVGFFKVMDLNHDSRPDVVRLGYNGAISTSEREAAV